MKLWEKGYSIDSLVEQFTVGNDRELDLRLAIHDVKASMAHARMLKTIGILRIDELEQILKVFEDIIIEIESGSFTIGAEFEDIHSKLEHVLVDRLGETGKKIHTARSRNDQVLVDLHLYVKEEIVVLKQLMQSLFNRLLELGEAHQDKLMPGYTHMQIAMPSSFGLWFGSYAESLIDDVIMLKAAYQIADQNPLGSAAGYGSSFPINREMTTRELGFSTMKYNVVAAQMSRGKLEQTLSYAMASVGNSMSKLASDICIYMSQNFGFIQFPKEFTTGSSIMPHKQNPDVFELIRGKCNRIQNLPGEIALLINSLPSGYHRDFQLLKEPLFRAIDNLKEVLNVTEFMLRHIQVNKHIMEDELYRHAFSVEEVNKLVMDGMSFRDAYEKVGKDILNGNFKHSTQIQHSHTGSIHNPCFNEIRQKMRNLN